MKIKKTLKLINKQLKHCIQIMKKDLIFKYKFYQQKFPKIQNLFKIK